MLPFEPFDPEGVVDGTKDGTSDGRNEGPSDGINEGILLKVGAGLWVGLEEGAELSEGAKLVLGIEDGKVEGSNDGSREGASEGASDLDPFLPLLPFPLLSLLFEFFKLKGSKPRSKMPASSRRSPFSRVKL